MIKSIPPGPISDESKLDYITIKKSIQTTYNLSIIINPKVDNKTQRRVQCSLPNFIVFFTKYLTYKSPTDIPNLVRGATIPLSINSKKRTI